MNMIYQFVIFSFGSNIEANDVVCRRIFILLNIFLIFKSGIGVFDTAVNSIWIVSYICHIPVLNQYHNVLISGCRSQQ